MKNIMINATWDIELNLWIATCEKVPDLLVKEATAEKIIQKCQCLIPKLLAKQGILIKNEEDLLFRSVFSVKMKPESSIVLNNNLYSKAQPCKK